MGQCRTLEAAAAVLDIQPVQSSGVEEDIVTCLQDYGAKAIRRRFKELSVVVHPDKCTLTGARQVHIHEPVKSCCSCLSDILLLANGIDCPMACDCACLRMANDRTSEPTSIKPLRS
jgi:hypothetical protein